MRGKPHTDAAAIRPTGITPAGAGKTALMPDGGAVKWDHPRRCGENSTVSDFFAFAQGSPPQVRGKLADVTIDDDMIGITPAGAGKTHYKLNTL